MALRSMHCNQSSTNFIDPSLIHRSLASSSIKTSNNFSIKAQSLNYATNNQFSQSTYHNNQINEPTTISYQSSTTSLAAFASDMEKEITDKVLKHLQLKKTKERSKLNQKLKPIT
eukprot:902669_1